MIGIFQLLDSENACPLIRPTYGGMRFLFDQPMWKPVIAAATDARGRLLNFEVLCESDFRVLVGAIPGGSPSACMEDLRHTRPDRSKSRS
jgi:hypothetical protein